MKNLNDLPNHSRVWVYQANRQLNSEEKSLIESKSNLFLKSWAAHGADLDAAIEIYYDQFVVLSVDENVASATGCSIDKSVHFFQQLGTELNIDFFNRLLVAYKQEDEIKLQPLSKFGDLLSEGEINDNTTVFNNLVVSLGDFRSNWEVSIKDSWHKQLLPA